jgi:hypothetical protein
MGDKRTAKFFSKDGKNIGQDRMTEYSLSESQKTGQENSRLLVRNWQNGKDLG